jgi:hypothetical protein
MSLKKKLFEYCPDVVGWTKSKDGLETVMPEDLNNYMKKLPVVRGHSLMRKILVLSKEC